MWLIIILITIPITTIGIYIIFFLFQNPSKKEDPKFTSLSQMKSPLSTTRTLGRLFFIGGSFVALAIGIAILSNAKSAIHEIEGFLLFIITAILLSTEYIVTYVGKSH